MKSLIDVAVPMRDGVRLSADLRFPDSAGPFPVLVLRTPYNNCDPTANLRFVQAGYVLVQQDCRGRFDSDGTFSPFQEANDGEDTIAWVRRQPWCDGRIGMFGGSYCGHAQLCTAWSNPPGLLTIMPKVMGCDAFKDLIYQNGIPDLTVSMTWAFGMTGRAGQNLSMLEWPRIQRHLPLLTMDQAAGVNLPYFREWLSHGTHDAFWRAQSVEQHWASYNLPILHIGGWFDFFAEGQVRNFVGIRRHGGPQARACQKLVMGPWGHGLNTRSVGQWDFGAQAVIGLDQLEARWLARWVLGEDNGIDREPPVSIFVTGSNVWREEQDWPLARAQEQVWHLHSGGRANSLFGDGQLLPVAPLESAADRYCYNPDNPVPTMGGRIMGAQAGPQDHAPIERRDDVLVYTAAPLSTALEVIGEVSVVLYLESDAPDTDFIARLCDVFPDGRSFNLCEGVIRMRFREGLEREVRMQPGQVYEVPLALGPLAHSFLPGHSLRLELTSSSFPRLARNLNTGESMAIGTRLALARQAAHHGPNHPARLLLPVIPAG